MSAANANNNNPLVRFKNVRKSYDGKNQVVRHLNLDIRRGEFLTLLGPSGSGKTTTLMMLAGFETPTSGTIELAGEQIDNLPPHKRNIGMVFQNYALFPHITVQENVAFPLKVRKVDAATRQQKVSKALAMVQLNGMEKRYPSQLSGGQQQRVALARALVFEPELVLMDEPLGALDKQLREHMQLEIKRLHGELGVTVVYVTHDQDEALTMSDRVAVFHDGMVQQIGSPQDIYEAPDTAFVAGFIGENNRTHGTIAHAGARQATVDLDSGMQIQGTPQLGMKAGDRVSVSIRPERIAINPAQNATDVRCQGKVREVIYLGDHVRVRLVINGDPDFVVKQPVSQVQQKIAVGDTVDLGWNHEFVRLLDPIEVTAAI
ncbi:spermidine/putrescine ABC transporter ATP-binding protein [Advenella sp. S44]|uniref:ABC transporter ATP-binding protein n=1 Tax=Advenella sp. S44 TaxID=1982755 RepID=UPI000C29E6EC|nr:ABC transporter ATP-binding protein [Advenella sp. S44]PJX27740.1 spermidine/putrescine ABC transporter ATP-binding protein [Advenella sp. S44]